MPKLYVVEFKHKEKDLSFLKIGYTREYDVMERFSPKTSSRYGNDPKQYDAYNIRVLASAYTSNYNQVLEAEETLKSKYPKNLWIKEKFSGVTEIVQLDQSDRRQLIEDVLRYRGEWADERRQARTSIV